jgi:YtcA family
MIANRICGSQKRGYFIPYALLLGGCSRAPSVDVMGSFFPAWLVCLVLGVALTAAVGLALWRLRIRIAIPMLVYPSLTAIFTFVLRLLFFG